MKLAEQRDAAAAAAAASMLVAEAESTRDSACDLSNFSLTFPAD
jgi:hypothetical protein